MIIEQTIEYYTNMQPHIGAGARLLPDFLGVLSYFLMVIAIIIGEPIIRSKIARALRIKAKYMIDIHCTIAFLAIFFAIIHAALLSQVNEWLGVYQFYELFPTLNFSLIDPLNPIVGLEYGRWAFLFMVIAALFGLVYYRLIKKIKRKYLIWTQRITYIGVIFGTFHIFADYHNYAWLMPVSIVILVIIFVLRGYSIYVNYKRKHRKRK